MKRGAATAFLIVLLLTLFLTFLRPQLAHADIGTDIDSGWALTPPNINGIMALGEWANATVRDFTINMTSRTNGALNTTLYGRLYVENNLTYAFLAVQLYNTDYEAKDAGGKFDGLFMLFDENDTGTLVLGDNGEGMQAWNLSPYYSSNDLYYDGAGSWYPDTSAPGNNDGAMAWSHTDPVQYHLGNWTFEMMIPLVGSDGYDFHIASLPHTVGYKIWYEQPYNGLDGVYPDDPTILKSLDETTNAATFGDMTFYPLYNLTMVAGPGGTTNPTPSPPLHQYQYKTVVSATATTDPLWEFDHWELDSLNVGAANPYSVTMDQNHTLKAVFQPPYALTITTTTGGNTNPVPGTYIYPNGTLVPVSASPSIGYDFDHWELDTLDVGTANPYSVLMTQNHTLNAVFVKQLSVSISPVYTTFNLGGSVTFNSAVTGGTPAYSYQWYLGSSPVSGAMSASWTFTPPAIGTYYVYLNVTDSRGRVAVSNTAQVVVTPVPHPVGGYSVSLAKTPASPPVAYYVTALVAFGAVISIFKRKRTGSSKSSKQ